ncbi:MAG TPA: hypothetical protein VIC28_15110, partial [Thermoanaerobaculia bacterium]
TEPGSSGSGLFRADTGQLYGQLFGGPSFCGVEPDGLFDCYGSFAVTFPRIKNLLLKGGSDDKSEQNDSCAKARIVKTGGFPGRIVKVLDEDWYKISIKPGQTVDIGLLFNNADGDIDFQFFEDCKGAPIFTEDSTFDNIEITATNNANKAAFLIWRAYLANDTRNSYDMTISFP